MSVCDILIMKTWLKGRTVCLWVAKTFAKIGKALDTNGKRRENKKEGDSSCYGVTRELLMISIQATH